MEKEKYNFRILFAICFLLSILFFVFTLVLMLKTNSFSLHTYDSCSDIQRISCVLFALSFDCFVSCLVVLTYFICSFIRKNILIRKHFENKIDFLYKNCVKCRRKNND